MRIYILFKREEDFNLGCEVVDDDEGEKCDGFREIEGKGFPTFMGFLLLSFS